jgi:hypothetical protein
MEEWVILFYSVQGALKAEKILKKEGIPYKLIPVPRHLSSDCGIALKFEAKEEERIRKLLEGKVPLQGIFKL